MYKYSQSLDQLVDGLIASGKQYMYVTSTEVHLKFPLFFSLAFFFSFVLCSYCVLYMHAVNLHVNVHVCIHSSVS